jgi:hypothetical protein
MPAHSKGFSSRKKAVVIVVTSPDAALVITVKIQFYCAKSILWDEKER